MTRFIAAASLLFAVSSNSLAQCRDSDRLSLVAIDKAWTEAIERGDKPSLEKLYSPSFVSHRVTGPVDRSAALATLSGSAARSAVAGSAGQVVDDHYVVSCTSKTATISHRTKSIAASGSTQVGRAVHFLEKTADGWAVVSTAVHFLSDADELAYMELDWNDATRTHNSDWVQANYADFSIEVSSRTGGMDTKSQSIESAKNDKRIFDSLEMSEFNVHVEGDAAVATGINHAVGKDAEGKPMDRKIRFTDTFIKKDGRWQVWATQGTLIQ